MGDEFVKGLLALIGVGDRTTDAVKTSQGVMDGSKSEFAKKMNWLSENPNMTDQQRQLIGQTGQTGSAWQEKMNWLQDNPNMTDQEKQILGIDVMRRGMHNGVNMLGSQEEYSSDVLRIMTERALAAGLQPGTMEFRQFIHSGGTNQTDTIQNLGIGARGMDTLAERDYLQGAMIPGGNSMQESWGGQPFPTGSGQESMIPFGTRGLDTAAERDFLANSYVGGQNLPTSTVGQGAMQGQLGAGTMPTGQPNMGALGMRAEFNRQMSALPPQEVQRVQQILAQLNDEQRKTFMQGVANGNTPLGGYGVQDESFRQ